MKRERAIRVLIAKAGLDGHDVGAKIVVRALLAAGFDVLYTGLRKSPEEIVHTARDEDVDVLGLSILPGSHMPICERVGTLRRECGLQDLLWLVGGVIPVRDRDRLTALGVDGVFPGGTPLGDIVQFIRARLT